MKSRFCCVFLVLPCVSMILLDPSGTKPFMLAKRNDVISRSRNDETLFSKILVIDSGLFLALFMEFWLMRNVIKQKILIYQLFIVNVWSSILLELNKQEKQSRTKM